MTDLAKAREIAKMILSRKPEQAVVYNAEVLAQAFLALSEKCEKMQAVVEAAKKLSPLVARQTNEWIALDTSLKALERGEG